MGVVLVGVNVVHLTREPSTPATVAGVVVPLVLSVGVVGLGLWMARGALSPVMARSVSGWFVAGILWMAFVGVAVTAYYTVEGSVLSHPYLIVGSFASYGAVPAVVTGWYDGQRRTRLETVTRQRRTLETYRQAIEYTAHAVAITDADGTIEYVNPAFESMTGYTAAEAVGRTPRILKSGEHDDAFYERLWSTILDGEVWEAELVDRRKDGTLIYIDQTIAPVIEDGDIVRFVAVNSDVTDRRADRERLERQNERLELLNRMLRHDIGNDVQLVAGMAAALEDHVEPEGRPALEALSAHADNIVTLTQNMQHLLDSAIADSVDRRPVPLHDVLDTVISQVRTAETDATIEVGSLPEVAVEADDRLDSVFRNLLRNAVDHGATHGDGGDVHVDVDVSPATVSVHVADEGPGIPADERATIFEEGAMGEHSSGTGIGLYLVETLVEQYGGAVTVEANDPHGAVFVVTLARADV